MNLYTREVECEKSENYDQRICQQQCKVNHYIFVGFSTSGCKLYSVYTWLKDTKRSKWCGNSSPNNVSPNHVSPNFR